MSKEQKQFDGINDPANYRRLSEPMSQAKAEEALGAFFEEFYELRNKHGIVDAYVIAKIIVEGDRGEGEVLSAMHCGNQLSRESMCAWAFGMEQSQRKQRIAELLVQHPSVKATGFAEIK